MCYYVCIGGRDPLPGLRPLARGEPARSSAIPAHHPTASLFMAFQIEVFRNGEWTDDASLLGHGCKSEDNLWPCEKSAQAAIDDLIEVGFSRDGLRVAEIC